MWGVIQPGMWNSMSTTVVFGVESTRQILHQDPDLIQGLQSNSEVYAPV